MALFEFRSNTFEKYLPEGAILRRSTFFPKQEVVDHRGPGSIHDFSSGWTKGLRLYPIHPFSHRPASRCRRPSTLTEPTRADTRLNPRNADTAYWINRLQGIEASASNHTKSKSSAWLHLATESTPRDRPRALVHVRRRRTLLRRELEPEEEAVLRRRHQTTRRHFKRNCCRHSLRRVEQCLPRRPRQRLAVLGARPVDLHRRRRSQMQVTRRRPC